MQRDRLEAIRHHLYTQGACSIPALADAVGTSLATVRRDLQVLEQQGVVMNWPPNEPDTISHSHKG